jgi:RNA ligase (TIGR02306 family)
MQLATIQTIIKIEPIEGADKVELAEVLGWKVVIKKDEFKAGDLCIYIQIDTTIDPKMKCFSHLVNPKKPNDRVRINTKKIRGIYSQGLLISIDSYKLEPSIGLDVTNLFDVQKYEKEEIIYNPLNEGSYKTNNTIIGDFPLDIIPKTNEDHLKNRYTLLNKLLNKEIYISKKMDGSSLTIIKKNNEFIICSRNHIINEDNIMHQYFLRNIKDNFLANNNIVLQGEFCGPKVNGNKMKLNKHTFYVFNIKNLDTNKYMNLEEMQNICSNLNLETVPILDKIICDESWTIQKFQDYANTVTYDEDYGEGIVIRNCNDITISFKIINQNYND